MRTRILTLFILTLFLAACTSAVREAVPNPHGKHGGSSEGTTHTLEASPLSITDMSSDGEIAFSVMDDGNVLGDYGISHTKEMHLIIVRDDLRHFAHEHPERDAEGAWRVAYAPPAGGTYRIYADFVDGRGRQHLLRFERQYPGEQGENGLAKDPARSKTVSGYIVTLQEQAQGDEVAFTYRVTDGQGNAVELEEYLGAKGHSVLLSPDGRYVHTHPSDMSNTPTFIAPFPDTFHRIFMQFQVDGEVLTVSFDWDPEARESLHHAP